MIIIYQLIIVIHYTIASKRRESYFLFFILFWLWLWNSETFLDFDTDFQPWRISIVEINFFVLIEKFQYALYVKALKSLVNQSYLYDGIFINELVFQFAVVRVD